MPVLLGIVSVCFCEYYQCLSCWVLSVSVFVSIISACFGGYCQYLFWGGTYYQCLVWWVLPVPVLVGNISACFGGYYQYLSWWVLSVFLWELSVPVLVGIVSTCFGRVLTISVCLCLVVSVSSPCEMFHPKTIS